MLGIDFDALLSDVDAHLGRILAHFGLAADPAEIARIAAGPVLQKYSKAPEHDYGPGHRARVLDDARRGQQAEIARGLAWLERLARNDDDVAALLAADAG